MRFLVDAQLPPALARMISDAGHEAEHVFDIGAVAASDVEILQMAKERSAVIITKDEDFSLMTPGATDAPCIIWVRIGNTTRRALLEWFEPLLPQIIEAFDTGTTLIEIR